MTRADELLAGLRRLLADPEQWGTATWYAARELDDFMSAFGLLPTAWQVSISNTAAPSISTETRARAAVKLGLVIRERLEEAGLHDQALAGDIAQAVIGAIVEEHRQAEAAERYQVIYQLEVASGDALRATGMPLLLWLEAKEQARRGEEA